MKPFERLLKYVTFDTESQTNSTTFPSTLKQLELAKYLVTEMKEIGIDDAFLDDNGYVYGTINPSKGLEEKPGFALIAHMDTSPDVTGKNVKPHIVHYNGGDIILNEEKNIVTKLSDFPDLEKHINQHIIVTDGNTLLGADDKAGIAEIMTMAETLINDKSRKHPLIQIVFTPDEEVGHGVDKIDMNKIKVNKGYTVDGGYISIFQYETFNGSTATIKIKGRSVHPGYSKGKMKNACLIANEFNSLLPQHEIPATTENREGFYHLMSINANVEEATLKYILRDHDYKKLLQREEMIKKAATFICDKYGQDTVKVEIEEGYRNMGEEVIKHPELIDSALEAIRSIGIEPQIEAVRGGTDGSRLSFMGLACPNLPTGCQNGHSRHEYISVEDMDKCTEILLKLSSIMARG